MKTIIALRHVNFEGLGIFEVLFERLGFHITYHDVGLSPLTEQLINCDLFVVLGAPIGANDEIDYPFLGIELELIRLRLTMKKPILGFCLGAQLIAKALGAKVYRGQQVEIGWYPISITEEGMMTPVRHLNANLTNMFHWHGDVFDLPVGANRLASSNHCLNQIISIDRYCLAFQCHPEILARDIESWLVGHASELARYQINVGLLRTQTQCHAKQLEQQAIACMREWLESLAL